MCFNKMTTSINHQHNMHVCHAMWAFPFRYRHCFSSVSSSLFFPRLFFNDKQNADSFATQYMNISSYLINHSCLSLCAYLFSMPTFTKLFILILQRLQLKFLRMQTGQAILLADTTHVTVQLCILLHLLIIQLF